MKVTDYYFKPLYSLLKEILLTQAVLHADETSYRVLESSTQKTYYWTFLSGKQEKKPIPPTTKGKSLSKQGVHYCNQMFTLERSWENLSSEERHQKRQEKLKPLFDEFFK